jgi:DNA polymerase III epsilon subunit-like protein
VLAVKTLPGLPSYEGIVVATTCEVYNPNPHRAESDVRMSAGILFELIKRLRAQGQPMSTVQDLLAWQGVLN